MPNTFSHLPCTHRFRNTWHSLMSARHGKNANFRAKGSSTVTRVIRMSLFQNCAQFERLKNFQNKACNNSKEMARQTCWNCVSRPVHPDLAMSAGQSISLIFSTRHFYFIGVTGSDCSNIQVGPAKFETDIPSKILLNKVNFEESGQINT